MYVIGLENFTEMIKKHEGSKIAVVGAGTVGRKLLAAIKNEKVKSIKFMDNNKSLYQEPVEGTEVGKIEDLGDDWIYIISVENPSARNALEEQLLENHIKKEKIYIFSFYKNYEYYKEIYLSGKCKEELSEAYRNIFSRELNWDNPTRYTEILNVEKLEIDDPFRTKLADKVEVRKWVKEKIGEQYLTKRYHEWDRVEEIDFTELPQSFALKLNNGSGRNIIVKDKNELDIEETRRLLSEWYSQNYAFCGGAYEIQYKDIKPKIICEEYLEGVAETVYDYNIYCFHGKPKYIWCIKGSHRPECQASFYDREWNMQPFSFGYPKDSVVAPKPEKLEEMLRLSEILCQGFRHVRVDWYNLPDGRVLFGEITFTTWSGLRKFVPDEYDEYFGRLILGKK